MKRLWRAAQFFRPDGLRITGAIGLMVLGIWAGLLKPWPLALIVDGVFGQKPLPHWLGRWEGRADQAVLVAILGAVVFALHAGQGLISAAQNYLAIQIGLRGLRRVRGEVFARIQRLSLRYHQGAQSGDTIYRATWDPYTFQTLFQHGLMTFLTALLSLLMMMVVMWRLDRPLTLVAIGVVPPLLIIIQVFGHKMRVRGAAAQRADSQVATLVHQNLAALPLIQSYTREAREQARFSAQAALAEERRLAQHGWELLYWLAISGIFALGTAAIVWFGSRQVMAGKITIGELLIFLAYLTQLYDPLNQLSHVGSTVSHAGAGTQRVFELLDAPEAVREKAGAMPIATLGGAATDDNQVVTQSAAVSASVGAPAATARAPQTDRPRALELHGAIEFEQVGFGYVPEQPVLRGLNFRLEAGRSAAIIGPSGAGKTTLLQLLPRFYDPDSGAVRLDGVDVRELRLKDLRRHVALVMQEPILLPGTIGENIACGVPDASLDRIERAARAAHADEFIRRLPRQYDTLVGEGAARLSVGEKQRLSLARAFLKDAPILVLDEPTSALDADSEALVVAGLADLMKGRTTLLVSHRQRTLRHVDCILVLDQGALVESGTPEELLRNPDSYYARMSR